MDMILELGELAVANAGGIDAKIDPMLCQMRVSRLVDACATGRIINARQTEGLQLGGAIEGLSLNLQVEAKQDPLTRRIRNSDEHRLEVITAHKDAPY